jgi:hypothetical protein
LYFDEVGVEFWVEILEIMYGYGFIHDFLEDHLRELDIQEYLVVECQSE